jgi:RNA-binding protein
LRIYHFARLEPNLAFAHRELFRMTLTEKQKKYLRGLAHPKHPIVMIGQQGLSPGIAAEFDSALSTHELVKISVRVGDREARDAILAELSKQCTAELIQRIGNVAVFYRPKKDQARIVLPG